MATCCRGPAPTDSAFYNWDFKNRLISADTDGDGTIDVQNEYDDNGIRVSQTVEGQETRFLIDPLEEFARVVLEYRPGGLIVASYVYGQELISQERDEAGLPPDCEPLLVAEDGRLRPADVIEDELLLALPLVPVNPDSRLPDEVTSPYPAQDHAESERSENPFALLRELKK